MLLLPTPVRQTAHGNSPKLCRRSRPVPQIIIFVFTAFTLFFLFCCFLPIQEPPDTFLQRFSDDNKIIGIEVLPGDPRAELARQGLKHNDEASLGEHRPSNSPLYPSPTRTRLRALAYIPCTSRLVHSSTPNFLSAHQMTFRGTQSNAFSRSTKAM